MKAAICTIVWILFFVTVYWMAGNDFPLVRGLDLAVFFGVGLPVSVCLGFLCGIIWNDFTKVNNV